MRKCRDPFLYEESLGLQSNFQSKAPVLGSRAYNQPSPPGKITCIFPFTLAATGLPHCPFMILSPGKLLCHAGLPVSLFTAKKLGASGDGSSPRSPPLPFDVTTNTRSSMTSGEQLAI